MDRTVCMRFCATAFVIAVSASCLAPMSATADEPKPWTLRDHYTFKGSEASLSFDVKTAEWKIDINGLGSLTGNIQSEVEVDGRTVVVSALVKAKDEREAFSSPLGDGTFFRSVFEPQAGVVIRYAITRLIEQPFMIMRMSVENVSASPVELSAMRPVILDGGYLAAHTKLVTATAEHAGHRGGFALVEQSEATSVVRFDLRDSPATIGLGVIRSGDMDSGLYFNQNDEGWSGRIECRFEPALRLSPGEIVEADPVWVSFQAEDPSQIRQFHGFAQSMLFPAPTPTELPASWITVSEDATAEDLYRVAERWSQSGMRYVLVDESIDGASLKDAKALGKISKKLGAMGLVAGARIDPIAELVASNAPWTVAEARAHAERRTKTLIAKGFEFFVLPETRVSDEALRAMNLTRAQANAAALAFVTEAADGRPVVPAPTVSLMPDPAQWRQAADTTYPYDAYGMATGPVRFDVEQLKSISSELRSAIQAFPGPIELVGQPRKKVAQSLNEVNVARTALTGDWNSAAAAGQN